MVNRTMGHNYGYCFCSVVLFLSFTHWGRDKMATISRDDIFNRIFVNENVIISIKFSLQFVPKGQINNIPVLVQTMAWRRPGNKPLSEAVMVSLLTHICVPRSQWVNWNVHVTTLSEYISYRKIATCDVSPLVNNATRATYFDDVIYVGPVLRTRPR